MSFFLCRATPALLLLGALSSACSSNPPAGTGTTNPAVAPDSLAIQQTAQAYRVQYMPPVPIDSSQYVYQPVVAVPLPSNRPLINIKDGLSTSSATSTVYDSASGPVFNLLFSHLPSGRTHLLFPNGDYRIEQVAASRQLGRRLPYIFYQVILTDRDQNGELTPADGRVLFVSDRSGQQLRQLTPDSARLESWQLTPDHLLLAELRYDSDRNGQLDGADANYWIRCDLRAPQAAPLSFAPDSITQQVQQQMLRRQSRLKQP